MWFVYTIVFTVCWSVANISDSILIRHHHKHPVILNGIQSFAIVFTGLAFLALG
jgi:hypothetical protein